MKTWARTTAVWAKTKKGTSVRTRCKIATVPAAFNFRRAHGRVIRSMEAPNFTAASWPDLFRPSTSLVFLKIVREDVDVRDKRGHDG